MKIRDNEELIASLHESNQTLSINSLAEAISMRIYNDNALLHKTNEIINNYGKTNNDDRDNQIHALRSDYSKMIETLIAEYRIHTKIKDDVIHKIRKRVITELRNKLALDIATGIYSENTLALKESEAIEKGTLKDENTINDELDVLIREHTEKMKIYQISYIVRKKIFDDL